MFPVYTNAWAGGVDVTILAPDINPHFWKSILQYAGLTGGLRNGVPFALRQNLMRGSEKLSAAQMIGALARALEEIGYRDN